jgi:hypothetical protein
LACCQLVFRLTLLMQSLHDERLVRATKVLAPNPRWRSSFAARLDLNALRSMEQQSVPILRRNADEMRISNIQCIARLIVSTLNR